MKIQSLSTLVALASAVQLAAANGWLDAEPFQCPGNSDNHCSPEQGSGFDWTGLSIGGFGHFGGFDFTGWQCSDSFAPGGKRSLGGNSFQSKCITGVTSQEGSSNPSFGCGSDSSVPDFSVDTFQVTSEFDCDLDFHYGMPDGSTCKQTSPCSSGGSTIKNTQCGGAKNVTVVYPGGGPKPTCSIGVHSIGFDCSSHSIHSYTATTVPQQSTPSYVQTFPTTTVVSSPATTSPVYSVTTPVSTPVSSPSTPISSPVYSVSTPTSAPVSSASVPTSAPVSSASTPASSPSLVTSTIYTTSVQTINSCAATVTNCPDRSTVLTTITIAVSTTVCPVTATQTSPQGVATSQVIYSNSTISAPSSVYPVSSAVATSSPGGVSVPASSPTIQGYSTSSPASSASPLPYPSILPQCLNTWIPMLSSCTSNTQADCYCPSESLVCSVYDCLYAHGASSSDISSAQNYFKGICVNQLDSNPALLSCSTQVTGPTSYPTGPVTTVTVKSTVVVPCSQSGTAIPSSYSTTVVTTSVVVPQVVLTTVPGPASTVALVTGSPAPVTPGAQTVPAPQSTFAAITVPAPGNGGNSSSTPTPTPVSGSASQAGLGFSCFIAASLFLAVFAL